MLSSEFTSRFSENTNARINEFLEHYVVKTSHDFAALAIYGIVLDVMEEQLRDLRSDIK